MSNNNMNNGQRKGSMFQQLSEAMAEADGQQEVVIPSQKDGKQDTDSRRKEDPVTKNDRPGMKELKESMEKAQEYSKEVQEFLLTVSAGCTRFELEKGYYEEYRAKLLDFHKRIGEVYQAMEVATDWTYSHKDIPKTGDVKDQYNTKERNMLDLLKILSNVNSWLGMADAMIMKALDQAPEIGRN